MTVTFIGGPHDGRTQTLPQTIRLWSFPVYGPDRSIQKEDRYFVLEKRDGITYFAHLKEWSLLKGVDEFSVMVN